MNAQESTLINELFDRIAQNSGQQRDQEAEQLIQSKVAANPHAPYVLAQSTIILQQAVTAAQSRIASLEKQLSEANSQTQGGGFLSGIGGLFGTPQAPQPPQATRPSTPPPIPQQAPASSGGGFLQNAMATAAGVAGGALLFQGIQNLMGHGGGFGGGLASQGQPTEVINNYYMDQNGDDRAQGSDDQGDLVADNDDQGDFDSEFNDGGDDSFV